MAGGIVNPAIEREVHPFGAQRHLAALRHTIVVYEPEFEPIATSLPVERKIRLSEEYEVLLDRRSLKRIDFMHVDENSVAEKFPTSGSTGTPKGGHAHASHVYLHVLSVVTCSIEPATDGRPDTIPLFHANGWGHAHATR